ncbi:hypothetical protein AVEN_190417-1 [Araneus ventricosus]|uniref:Uncharacterized protein n=1 Tax=Araneus ventricosus TaxID=182803 RepID=A0A4Y2LBM8_ARAVE|nr:hypothetical protein AVEN_190417-1 [Araneus ventricosus]
MLIRPLDEPQTRPHHSETDRQHEKSGAHRHSSEAKGWISNLSQYPHYSKGWISTIPISLLPFGFAGHQRGGVVVRGVGRRAERSSPRVGEVERSEYW